MLKTKVNTFLEDSIESLLDNNIICFLGSNSFFQCPALLTLLRAGQMRFLLPPLALYYLDK